MIVPGKMRVVPGCSMCVYSGLEWSTCVLNGYGEMGCFFGIVPVSGGYCTGRCSNVVRMLFGCSGGMFGCTQEKCEQSPNKVSSNTGTRPDQYRIPVAVSDQCQVLK